MTTKYCRTQDGLVVYTIADKEMLLSAIVYTRLKAIGPRSSLRGGDGELGNLKP